jgi:hypothetical protein
MKSFSIFTNVSGLLILFLIAGCSSPAQPNGSIQIELPTPTPTPNLPITYAISSEPLLTKDEYRDIDIENLDTFYIPEFWDQYSQAVAEKEFWVTDPVTVALRFSGYPNIDGIKPAQIVVYSFTEDNIMVVVTWKNLMDDSIRDKEHRIDLVSENGIWTIEWAGWRQRCYRSSFDGWVTDPCP